MVRLLVSKTCSTCSNWDKSHNDTDTPIGFKPCLKILDIKTAAESTINDEPEPLHSRKLKEEFKSAKAIAVDGEEYYAALFTLADFGCCLWQEATS